MKDSMIGRFFGRVWQFILYDHRAYQAARQKRHFEALHAKWDREEAHAVARANGPDVPPVSFERKAFRAILALVALWLFITVALPALTAVVLAVWALVVAS